MNTNINQHEVNKIEVNQNNTDLPKIIIKIAQTLDGKICTSNGQSKWITNEESRLLSHKLRLECDAILVGSNTIMKDNPKLNIRIGENEKLIWRVVLNAKNKIALDFNVFSDENRKKTILFFTEDAQNKIRQGNLISAGVNIHKLNLENDNFNLREVLTILKLKYNINKIIIEGGAKTISAFIKEDLFDEVHIFIAPKIFGAGISSFSGFDAKSISNSPKLKLSETKIIKDTKGDENNIYLKLVRSND
ncbi:MAG: RibD family protein [Candidatus Kapaibacteriota bacterium]|jgi:diaminohydroxyphosphoribosylaminopyrimidine deaminase/5-amino-6-(5-phosphoribosylamino)uracil reductase